jgi:hypothetical protein
MDADMGERIGGGVQQAFALELGIAWGGRGSEGGSR